MPWGRLDDNAAGNGKLLALSDPAFRMWACGLIYCQRNLTDGFIHDHAIESFGIRAKNKHKIAEELCRPQLANRAALWARVNGGYQIHDYLQWNDSREEILKNREKGRTRTARWRDAEAECDASQRPSQSPSQEPSPLPSPNASPVVRGSGEKEEKDRSELLERFDRFFAVYPNQQQREPARMLFLEMAPSGHVTDQIVESVRAYRRLPSWQKAIAEKDVRFIPLAKNFLRNRLWLDHPAGVPTVFGACRGGHNPPCVDDIACTQRRMAESDGIEPERVAS